MAFMDKFYLLPFVFLLFLERFFLLATLDTSSIGVFSIFAGIFLQKTGTETDHQNRFSCFRHKVLFLSSIVIIPLYVVYLY